MKSDTTFKPGSGNKVTFMTQKELKKFIKDLIDLGAKCQKNRSFSIVPSDGPIVSVYEWAFERAEKLFAGRGE